MKTKIISLMLVLSCAGASAATALPNSSGDLRALEENRADGDKTAVLTKEETNTDFYSSLHKNLQEKMISLTGKKQKMLQGKYAFLLNEKDLKLRLQKVIKEYQLNDPQKVEKVLLLYVEKCNKARFEYTPTLEYYIWKEKSSRLATDYLNDSEEVEQSTSSELLI